MTPTDAQIEAVRKILYEWFATSIEMDNSDWDSAAEEAIAALDIEKIEREAYERVRRILLSRGVSDYLDEVFMEPEYWDSEHDDFSGKLVHYLNMEKVMSVLVTKWLGDEEIKDFDDE